MLTCLMRTRSGYSSLSTSAFPGLKICQLSPPNETDQLYNGHDEGREIGIDATHCRPKRPHICRSFPPKIKHRLGASKDGRANNWTFNWIRVGVDHTCVPTISQLHFSEASRIVTIIDEDVIGLDIYDIVRASCYRK